MNLAVDPCCEVQYHSVFLQKYLVGSVFKIKAMLFLAYRELPQNSLYFMKKQGKQVTMFSSEGAILKIINQAFKAKTGETRT